MDLVDHLNDLIDMIQGTSMEQLALIAVVTMVTAGVVYLLVDALRYRAIPVLNVELTSGDCVGRCCISSDARYT